MNVPVMEFVKREVKLEYVKGKRIIDVGSLNVNGSTREHFNSFSPSEYKGVDIRQGPEVDEICDACDLIDKYTKESFDFVISCEMLEHAKDWRCAINNMKSVIRPDGYILITTRSKGAGFHGYPSDYWRYSVLNTAYIFSDFEIISIATDYQSPGVFVFAKKPHIWIPNNLNSYELYSIKNELKENL